MKKSSILIRCILFTLIFSCLFIGISYVLRPVGQEEIGAKGFYAEKKNTLDVVYIGGSVCIVDWMPYEAWKEQGIVSYAFGKSTLYSMNVLPMVKEALEYQSPELLIIDLRPFQYTGTEREILKANFISLASAMPVSSLNRLEILRNGLQYSLDIEDSDNQLTFYVDMIRFHSLWKNVNTDSFKYAIPGLHSNNTKGFLFVGNYSPIKLTDNTSIKEQMDSPAVAEANLNGLLSFLKATGQKAIFTVAPSQETEDQRKQYNYLAQIVTDSGFQYINVNDYYCEMGVNEKLDFYNADHPNVFGAEKYTKFLSRYIDSLYDLPDRRGNAQYVQWEEGYNSWLDQLDQTKSEVQDLIAAYHAEAIQNELK